MSVKPMDAKKVAAGASVLAKAEEILATRPATVDSVQAEARATDFLKVAGHFLKELEACRVAAVKPLNDEVASINAWYKEQREPLDKARRDVEALVLSWRREEAARVAEENKRIAAEQETRRLEQERKAAAAAVVGVPVAPVAQVFEAPKAGPATTVKTEAATGYVRKTWTFEVVDASLIPREFLSLDEARVTATIRQAVEAKTVDALQIPGLRIFQKEAFNVR